MDSTKNEGAHEAGSGGHEHSSVDTLRDARLQTSHRSHGCGGCGSWMFMAMIGVFIGLFVIGYLLD